MWYEEPIIKILLCAIVALVPAVCLILCIWRKGQMRVGMSLDPVNDGVTFLSGLKRWDVKRKDEGSLVIATNGRSRILGIDDTADMLLRLSKVSYGEFLGNSDYIVILNGKKIHNVKDGKYFIGSALILRGGEGGLKTLTGDEYEEAKKEFKNHLVTLVCGRKEIPALELAP